MNLKDPKNPGLRHQVLTGVIKPEKIAVMTAEVSVYLCSREKQAAKYANKIMWCDLKINLNYFPPIYLS